MIRCLSYSSGHLCIPLDGQAGILAGSNESWLKMGKEVLDQSKDNMDIQAATLEYLDKAGKRIAFKTGEEIPKISVFVKALKPGESNEGSFDAIIPGTAVSGNTLGKIEINLVYVPSPLKRETFTLAEEIK